MQLQLGGKTAFISGSSQGIGFAIASALAAEGVQVVLNGRHPSRVDAAVDRIRRQSPNSNPRGIVADFGRPDDVARLLDRLDETDILVNNVGEFGLAAFESIDDDLWAHYFDVNVMSGVRLSRHLLGPMLERGWGRIIFVSSESGVNVPADMVHYGVTKAAMLALGNGLAKRTRGTAVTVNSIVGGPTFSEGVAEALGSLAAAQSIPPESMKTAVIGQNATTLLQRFIAPAEIAHLVAYLASPLAAATNGAAVRADGGVLTSML
ncbi:oxidoreductase [Frondihabitans sp. PAMC 28766]|uniref:SDR family NAD(P)-dependent oxidoreductase n=1 Tax=Frondihabitans sp. PAMC 28766 TaxID=1795630 RepID=UPI00078B52E2|nr:SDR family NAD(P)-dependent oxidoreductase [Frondihabitans sp. PAMC 28766]AMM18972.1 oxidoreductase [Frondihabitans sp. PAMC 28766]